MVPLSNLIPQQLGNFKGKRNMSEIDTMNSWGDNPQSHKGKRTDGMRGRQMRRKEMEVWGWFKVGATVRMPLWMLS